MFTVHCRNNIRRVKVSEYSKLGYKPDPYIHLKTWEEERTRQKGEHDDPQWAQRRSEKRSMVQRTNCALRLKWDMQENGQKERESGGKEKVKGRAKERHA